MRYWSGPPTAEATTGALAHFTVVLPEGDGVAFTNLAPLAISPDGTLLAYAGARAGKIQLFVYDFSTGETRVLEGTEGARSPFFNTDGRWIGFFANGKLKKITIGGTTLREIADAPDARGGSWGVDDNIYFAPTNASGLWKVPAAGGGAATQLTTLDPAAAEISHRNPYALPDGKALLFMVWTGHSSDEHRIEYLSRRGPGGNSSSKRGWTDHRREGPHRLCRPAGLVAVGAVGPAALAREAWNHRVPFRAQMDNEGRRRSPNPESGTFVHLMGADNRRLARIVWIDRAGQNRTAASSSATMCPQSFHPTARARVIPQPWRAPRKSGSSTSGRRASLRSPRPAAAAGACLDDGLEIDRMRGTRRDFATCSYAADRAARSSDSPRKPAASDARLHDAR